MTDKNEQHNTTTTSSPSISKPTTTANSTSISDCGDKSPKQTDDADLMVIPLTLRHTSRTWIHFTRKRVGKEIKVECNYCNKQLTGGPRAGTSHLTEHANKCVKRKCLDIRQTRLFGTQAKDGGSNDILSLAPYEFRQDKGRKVLTEMIILHEHPLTIVEHYGFKKYSNTLQPGFKVSCRNTTKKDIMQRYETEKEGISALLRKMNSRIALTTGMWTSSNQRKGYMVVTAHFIDNGWKLQSQTLRFLYVPAPHTAEVLAEHLKECIHSWNIDIRLSCITVDNRTTNDAMIDILCQEFPYGSLMLHGRFLHMRCCAHILNLIIQDGLSSEIKNGLDRIRDSVAFWTGSDKRNQNFEQVAKQVVPECTKKLQLDCKTRWNSTYNMFMVALNYKEVFVVLSGRESLFKNLPLNDDWQKVEKICELLEVFNDIILVFSASKYPTTNNYFPCICGVRITMSNWLSSPCDYIRKMVLVMLEKYNKYWADVNGLMGVATILDPRFKLKLICFYFEKFYDAFIVQAEIDRIEGLLHELVDEYGYRNGKNQASKSKIKYVGFFNTKGKGTMLN
ncbi:zinc finger BED domain-containing protein RICESLEEPER 2-like [Hibiscus syriacus]|uniref:zinc finger BED domain-containing protein RICESLEEPER 2-like n=1 Tax=Hibiscus syriacus TaxID=106335 RepID=UPI0019228355|nr:zinc finger BED domain-containing protein RICESLEEPER 2-like [Hibiscus syriacus]